jgi:hypothetical protein
MAAQKHRRLILTGFLAFAILGALFGCVLSFWFVRGSIPAWWQIMGALALVGASAGVGVVALGKLEKLDRERQAMRKGADGETRIAAVLAAFPDEFRVINSLSTPYGDLDHIVVGPTGVFIVDSKNWRGTVAADGRGELLLNGKPTDKPTIRPLVARTMSVREKIQTLSGFEPPFFQVLLAFPATRVEARWGTTGAALCITDDQLHDCIVEKKNSDKLDRRRVEALAQAFLALATMDKEFER